ncbi:tetratricopeptide repeat protein [Devosia insulae]|uniref:tetratricopeptide repeat protein n=1 Tax=Devosia insulae TaxID=408174 RepID=UPI00159F13CD|nr:tetratricopeptide repeat protein [Devosia insulae]
MRLKILAAVALLCATVLPAFAGEWEDALAAHDAGRYEVALALLEPLADAGNVDAQNKLSHMYWYGEGTPSDYARALGWSRRAAEAGSAHAMYDLGVHYRTGLGGVIKSDAEAFKWFLKSAEAGDSQAAGNVALSYLLGKGVERDLAQYAYWRRIALERGERSMQLLEALDQLAAGQPEKADQLLQSSAAKNLAEAQFQLAELFLQGHSGWPADEVQAHMWLTIAAASGCLEAPALAKRLAQGMNTESLSQSATLAEMWQAANPVEPGQVHPIKHQACKAAPMVNG